MHTLLLILRLIKASVLSLLGIKLIDPIEVFYLREENSFYPIVSKSGCSSVKLALIRRYQPDFTAQFPGIHHTDPAPLSDGKIQRLFFSTGSAYRSFARGKRMVLIIRNPYERIHSCFKGIDAGKNIMYKYPSGMDRIFRISQGISWEQFKKKIRRIPALLADRHFRAQAFYLRFGVEQSVAAVELHDIKFYFQQTQNDDQPIQLNRSESRDSDALLEDLKQASWFRKKYKMDLELYDAIPVAPIN